MSVLTDHMGSSANDKIFVHCVDSSRKTYLLSLKCAPESIRTEPITFHTGNPSDGINGITDEALLAIVIDRLKGWQEGPHKCRENALAQTHIETGLMWMQKRTRERQARGVEGTQEV